MKLSKLDVQARLDVAMGGKAAEEILLGEKHEHCGASTGLKYATTLATAIFNEYGGEKWIEAQINQTSTDGQAKQAATTIEGEIRKIMEESLNRAKTLIANHIPLLEALVYKLLACETLEAKEIVDIFLNPVEEGPCNINQ